MGLRTGFEGPQGLIECIPQRSHHPQQARLPGSGLALVLLHKQLEGAAWIQACGMGRALHTLLRITRPAGGQCAGPAEQHQRGGTTEHHGPGCPGCILGLEGQAIALDVRRGQHRPAMLLTPLVVESHQRFHRLRTGSTRGTADLAVPAIGDTRASERIGELLRQRLK